MSGWPMFTQVKCTRPTRSTKSLAVVNCTFKEPASVNEGNPDTVWNVGLQRQPNGTWLITEYGQG